mmetsp:Transcript_31765/g.67494  ORF Transcript_31765/g.67494 Transcript_31765/m.67494 type:complete len:210 (-) Transcript_31765:481-1110(-)
MSSERSLEFAESLALHNSKQSVENNPATNATKPQNISHEGAPARFMKIEHGVVAQMPQPIPKYIAPRVRVQVGHRFLGGRSKSARRRRDFVWTLKTSTARKYGKVMHRPPAITKGRQRSQAPDAMSKKEATLLGKAMLLMIRPAAKVTPAIVSPSSRAMCFTCSPATRPSKKKIGTMRRRSTDNDEATRGPSNHSKFASRCWGGKASAV